MKESKKLKNLIENDGQKLREKHADFYQSMLDNYYPEKETVKEEKSSFDFSRIFSRRALAGLACCLVLVLSVSFGIGFMINKNNGIGEVNNSGDEISIPENAQIVTSIGDTNYNVNTLMRVENFVTLSFGSKTLKLDPEVAIYVDVRESDGYRNFYYLTDVHDGDFYGLQIIFNPELERTSYLGEKTSTLNISGLEIVYSSVYAQNNKTVYFFAEAQDDGETLVINYSTKAGQSETKFIEFLNNIIE